MKRTDLSALTELLAAGTITDSEADRLADFLRQIAEAQPDAWMWQHDETGRIGFVDQWQVDNGWQKNNPRCEIVRPLYTLPLED